MKEVGELAKRLGDVGYLVDEGLATALHLAQKLGQPLLLEGEPGVGKTAAARSLAEALEAPLIRLQCFEGITAGEALYEWNYSRQLLAIRLADAHDDSLVEDDLFTEKFLMDRPLLRAVRHDGPVPPVVLIDEIDRADGEFEALLLEFLGEASVSVPEIGTFAANVPPLVVLTSNRTRELHDALKRRCLYHWITYPSTERAARIIRHHAPEAGEPLIQAASVFVQRARDLELDKPPGLAEAIDWVGALHALGLSSLEGPALDHTLGALAKTADDLGVLREEIAAGDTA